MPESDASSFFKRRGRRSVKTQDEINGEASAYFEKSSNPDAENSALITGINYILKHSEKENVFFFFFAK